MTFTRKLAAAAIAAVTAAAFALPATAHAELTPEGGINYHGGRVECYYSSNVLYHWRTPEWWCDWEGFWRTPEGYYVVAASDIEQGAVIETSKGTAQVLDCGCWPGYTDFYVAW